MSDYFRTLNRLEEEQEARGACLPTATTSKPRSAQAVPPLCSPIGNKGAPFATLFDNLRALANGRPVRSLVLAGASTFESVHKVAEGLVGQVTKHHLSAVVAKLVDEESRSVLRLVNGFVHKRQQFEPAEGLEAANARPGPVMPPDPLPLDLRGGPVPASLENWLEQAISADHLMIIEGPPLGCSLDGALVARACDGLAIVVEPEATAEDALRAAVERAQAVGCRVLGLVMNGTRDYIPGWVRRLAHSKTS